MPIGKLRAIFVRHGRGAEWHSVLDVGNPDSCRTVKDYLASVREEQLRVRVTSRQADPVLLSDVKVISRFIQLQLGNPALDAIQVFVLAINGYAVMRMISTTKARKWPLCSYTATIFQKSSIEPSNESVPSPASQR